MENNIGQIALALVVSLWASVSALVAGYKAVNEKRDVIVLGYIRLDPISSEPLPISMKHRRLMFQNDWVPLKFGLGVVSLAFAIVILSFPLFIPETERTKLLWSICALAAAFPGLSAFGWLVLGFLDFLFIKAVLDAEEKASKEQDSTK